MSTSVIADPRSISISFIRKVDRSKSDDVLSIVPNDTCNKMFNVAYRDGLNKIRNTNTISEYEVYDFLENMFTLLPLDEDPFKMVQITAPTFPAVMLQVNQLTREEVRDSIASVVKNTIRNWPTGRYFNKKDSTSAPISRRVTRSMAQSI